MRWIPFSILILIAALLEAGNVRNIVAISDWHIRPSLLIVLLAFFAVSCRMHEAIIASFVIGFTMDMIGGQMGPHTVSYCLIGGLLNQLGDHFPSRRIIHQVLLVFGVYLVAGIIAYWLGALKTGERQEYAYRIILYTAFYSACVAPIVWRILRHVHRMIAPRPPRSGRGYLR